MKEYITPKQLSQQIGKSARYVQIRAKKLGIKKRQGKYLFTKSEADAIINEQTNENETKAKNVDNDSSYINQTKSNEQADEWTNEQTNESEIITQEFTAKEYERLQSIIKDYHAKAKEVEMLLDQVKLHQNQSEYFKRSLERKDQQMDKLLETFKQTTQSIQQRNYIELNEKQRNEEGEK
jgi:monoamine oxidase